MDKNDQQFLDDYFSRYKRVLFTPNVYSKLLIFRDLCKRVSETGNKLIFAGNGASASISSHAATDFTQHAKVRTVCFNDHNLITAFSNDYGYENWVARALEAYADSGDVIVLISSSGKSPNIVNAAKYACEQDLEVVTFSGFAPDNSLQAMGGLNFWVDSRTYNVVESAHLILILAVANLLDKGGDDFSFLKKHFMEHERALFKIDHSVELTNFRDLCSSVSARGGKMIFAGNGGSSSIASHAATDLTKQSKVRTVCFNDHNLISAFSNDYGQEHWIEQCVKAYADPNDGVVLISSSGRSSNVINAANSAKKMGLDVVTFTGFDSENPLRKLGDKNFWVDSRNYNVTEAVHSIWICCVVDMLVGRAEYNVSDVP
jgi:D-sedoheptulose 7-phosphate isomerase